MSQSPPDDQSEEPKREKRSLFGQDLDRLSLFLKRAAALGALIGYLHHLRCFSGH